ncbi:helix-turn-helix transcriptional regulator [Terrabacter lapilli]|uniref:helix-turn-helix transcriptional regulator n=1 Tax=Terrabacter lapilli TaxID=436231 RepID=UPI0031D07CA0
MRSATSGPIALPELSAARLRVLQAASSRGDTGQGATVGELADQLGGHPNTTRAHLGALVADGLLDRVALTGGTRGRPANAYRLTERGRLVLESSSAAEPVATDELVTAMAEHLATTPDAEAHARAIGRRWAAQLAQETGAGDVAPADRVVAMLRTAGFSPQPEPSGDLALRTCPVLASARAHPGVVCTMHEEMLRAALADEGGAAAEDVQVSLVPFAREGACLVHLRRR